jgi:hypothetical protein
MKMLITVLLIVAIVAAGFFWLNRPQFFAIDAPLPAEFPRDGFSHRSFERLLRRFVDDRGEVDYAAWHASAAARKQLDSYLAAVSRFSPDNAPQRFESDDETFVYWIQAYNAWVIRAVLEHWPLDSVTDVKAPIEAVRGLGFFYRLRFEFGGRYYSLFEVENKVIRKRHRDARLHFVLNCASDSCPVLRPELPTGDQLEATLARAAEEFVSNRANVAIDHSAKTVTLSRIFKWFRRDFVNDLRWRGQPAERGVVDYVASVAPQELRQELAKTDGYDVGFFEYDWGINAR